MSHRFRKSGSVMFYYYDCLLYFFISLFTCTAEKVQYISTERPHVTYYNPKFVNYMNMTARRYGRNDPVYYVDLHMNTLQPWSNNVTVIFNFYEWKSQNEYRRSFLEIHFKLCDLIHKDNFFGTSLRQGKFAAPCPYLPGEYDLYNMTLTTKYIPPHFPFTKGRIYCNITATDTNEPITYGHIDMEIKKLTVRKKKN